MPIGNDEYTPTCAASCSDQTLAAAGETNCANSINLELAEINELYLDEKSATFGTPKNPILTYTPWSDNAAVLTTWKAAHDQTSAAKVRTYYGTGEKPEPNETTLTLHRGKIASIGTRHTLVYTINIIDDDTYQALLKLQACKGTFHMWYATDTYLYGADKGIIADVEKVVITKTGGRGDNSKAIITLGWNAYSDPVRDLKPWTSV